VKGTWREGSLARDPEVYLEKFWRLASLLIEVPFGKPGGGLIYWGL
jgi:hypothetical protein